MNFKELCDIYLDIFRDEMNKKVAVLTIIMVAMGEMVCGQVMSSPLVVYVHSLTLPPNEANGGNRIEITFYPDGLIRTFQDTYTNPITQAAEIVNSYRVVRDGSQIDVMYGKNSQDYSIQRFDIRPTSILVHLIDGSGKTDTYEIVRLTNSSTVSVYKSYYHFDLVQEYDFRMADNRLFLTATNARYMYLQIHRGAFPMMTSNGHGLFVFSRSDEETTIAEYKSNEGMPLRRYEIKGVPVQTQALIAVLNYELISGDFLTPELLWPYVGGAVFQN